MTDAIDTIDTGVKAVASSEAFQRNFHNLFLGDVVLYVFHGFFNILLHKINPGLRFIKTVAIVLIRKIPHVKCLDVLCKRK